MKKTFSFSWPSIRRSKSTSTTNHAQHDCFQHRLSFFCSASCVLHNLHIWRTSPRNPNSGTPFPEDWPIRYPILQGILLGVVWELLDVPGFSLDYTKNVGVFTIWSSWCFIIKTSTFTLHSHGNLNDEWSLLPLQWSSLGQQIDLICPGLSRYVPSAILRNPSSKLRFSSKRCGYPKYPNIPRILSYHANIYIYSRHMVVYRIHLLSPEYPHVPIMFLL